MPYLGRLTLGNILVPKEAATDVFEPKVLLRAFNEFLQILGADIHEIAR